MIYTTNSHYLTYAILFKRLGEFTLLSSPVCLGAHRPASFVSQAGVNRKRTATLRPVQLKASPKGVVVKVNGKDVYGPGTSTPEKVPPPVASPEPGSAPQSINLHINLNKKEAETNDQQKVILASPSKVPPPAPQPIIVRVPTGQGGAGAPAAPIIVPMPAQSSSTDSALNTLSKVLHTAAMLGLTRPDSPPPEAPDSALAAPFAPAGFPGQRPLFAPNVPIVPLPPANAPPFGYPPGARPANYPSYGPGVRPANYPGYGPGASYSRNANYPAQPAANAPGMGYPPNANYQVLPSGYSPGTGSPSASSPPNLGAPSMGSPEMGSPPYPGEQESLQGSPPMGSPPMGSPPMGSPPMGGGTLSNFLQPPAESTNAQGGVTSSSPPIQPGVQEGTTQEITEGPCSIGQ